MSIWTRILVAWLVLLWAARNLGNGGFLITFAVALFFLFQPGVK